MSGGRREGKVVDLEKGGNGTVASREIAGVQRGIIDVVESARRLRDRANFGRERADG